MQVKGQVDVPVMMVGGLRSFLLMEEILRQDEADFISISRPLIRQPGLIDAWRKDPGIKPKCISCNKCLEALYKAQPLHCVQEK
jgi:2,4-dienoyl-CoA reductase-like NADH-dependent reductase (Old Yellow Enzyme family)